MEKLLKSSMAAVALLMVGYHALYLFRPTGNALLHQNIHLAMALVLAALYAMANTQKAWVRIINFIMLAASLVVTIYIHINYERLHMFAGFPEEPMTNDLH